MKTKFIALLTLVAFVAAMASCTSSRKSGCPSNPTSNRPFRG